MVHRGGYSGKVRHDAVCNLYSRIKGGNTEEKAGELCDVFQVSFRFGEGCDRAKGAGVLHISGSDGEIWADPRPAPPLPEISQHHPREEGKIHAHTPFGT